MASPPPLTPAPQLHTIITKDRIPRLAGAIRTGETTAMDYTHTPFDETVDFVAGSYNIDSEHRLPYEGREVLYLMGSTSQLSGCCASTDSLRFITVPGFIVAWKSRKNEAGHPVSDIEVIEDENHRLQVKRILQQDHDVSNITFW